MKAVNLAKYQYLEPKNRPGSNLFFKLLVSSFKTSLTLGIVGLLLDGVATSANSQTVKPSSSNSILEQIDSYSNFQSDSALGQVTNITQLKDVSPTDWAYEALRSLVDRYGCISGFPNRTYRGDRPLSRYEFAAGLNSCLNQIERLIVASESISVEDLQTVQKLSEEFEAELVVLGGRVDRLEESVAILEDDQFSTTTTLAGEAVFSLSQILTGDNANGEEIDSEVVFGNRVRLAFNTSFTGEDLLLTQFTAGNFPFFSETLNTFEGDFGLIADNDNDLNLLVALYSFPMAIALP